MWGVFFEDINFGADGGLYAELVKNRSFEFPDHLMGWSALRNSGSRGSVSICDETAFDTANPHYVRIAADSDSGIGIANEGFRGMGIRKGETYRLSTESFRCSSFQEFLHHLRRPGCTLALRRKRRRNGSS